MRARRVLLLAGAGCFLLGSSLGVSPARAGDAVTVDDAGWWWYLQTNPTLPLPPPPNVEPGQLLVQGAPSDEGATAIAAIAATLPAGQANPVLTLEVAEGGDVGGDLALLLACQAGSPWTGGDAKPWAEKPQPACESAGVVGERAEDGTSWSFDLADLQFGDQVNLVLVPGVDEELPEGSPSPTFSLTFEPPTADAFTTSAGEAPTTIAPPITVAPVDPGAGFTPPTGGGISLPPVALPDDEQGMTPVAPSIQDANPLLPTTTFIDPRSEYAEGVGVALLLLGAGAIYLASRRRPGDPAGTMGGLGRFARPRLEPPPALRG